MRHHHQSFSPFGTPEDPRPAQRGTRSRHDGFDRSPDGDDPRRDRRGGGRRGGRGEGFGPAGFRPAGFRPEGFGPAGFAAEASGEEDHRSGGPRRHDPRFGGPGFGRAGFGGPGFGGPDGDPRFGGPEGDPRADHRGRGRGRGRGPHRAPRGDVRTAVLLLLADEPMHGYQLMQTISERTGGRWSPSPGAIYPTLSQLEDEGLVETTKEGGRKLASLTETGRAHVEKERSSWADPFPQAATDDEENTVDLRILIRDLTNPIRDIVRSGSDAQVREAGTILSEARRSLYRILAGDTASARDASTEDASADGPRDGGVALTDEDVDPSTLP